MSIVRKNLLTRHGYTPYCGNDSCGYHWPRTTFNGKQFACQCGWRSSFEPEFIEKYRLVSKEGEGAVHRGEK